MNIYICSTNKVKQDYLSEEKPADREVSRLFLAFSSSILNPQFILNRCIIMLKAHQYYIIKIIYILMEFYL